MGEYGPTMIIDQCESTHQHPPPPSRHAGNTNASTNTNTNSTSTGSLNADSDEEQQLLPNTNNGRAVPNNNSPRFTFANPNHPAAPSLEQQRAAAPPQLESRDSFSMMHNNSYGSLRYRTNVATSALLEHTAPESIRLQVVVWDVGPVDVALGRVPMTFRVTMFWDDEEVEEEPNNDYYNNQTGDDIGMSMDGTHTKPNSSDESTAGSFSRHKHSEWTMAGRRKAYERMITDDAILKKVDVPPISLLNVVTFNVIGQAEVCVLRDNVYRSNNNNSQRGGGVLDNNGGGTKTKTIRRRLMRWTCLYKATLLQNNMRLDTFPHDEHVLTLKLGLLVHRRPGGRWDMNKYRLDLATEDDSQHSTRIAHGLIVDHARVPDFQYNPDEGLDFRFVPCSVGGDCPVDASMGNRKRDMSLEVRLRVGRDSGYYDQNIMPLIGMLNLVAVTIPLSLESLYFFQRGLLLLNITFVQIGIRTSIDRLLPSVGYQIKMQSIMNQFFFSLLLLVLESSVVYVLNDRYKWTIETTNQIDAVVACMSLAHIIYTFATYYWNKVQLKRSLARGHAPPTLKEMVTGKMKKRDTSGKSLVV